VERRADGAEPAVLGISYQQIVMHAVSTDPELSSRPCIYLQLDEGSEGMPEEEEEEDAESVVPAELRLVPLDAAHGGLFTCTKVGTSTSFEMMARAPAAGQLPLAHMPALHTTWHRLLVLHSLFPMRHP
jgi:hypothetical protein